MILIIFIIVFIIYFTNGKQKLKDKLEEIIYNKFDKIEKNKNLKGLGGTDEIIKSKKRKKIKTKKRRKKPNKIKSNSEKDIIKNKESYISNFNINNNKKQHLEKFNGKIEAKENNINIKIDEAPDDENDYELNNLTYIQAIKYDKRTCCEYYISLLKNKQLFLFTFCSFNDYNSGIIKKFTLFLSFAIHYTINALFFTDDNMHQIYEDNGSYNISFQFPKILISSIASIILMRIMLETLILTDRNILQVKQQKTKTEAEKMKIQVLKYINIKFIIFFVVNFILLILFWFYLTCFNGVYENTQVYLIENTFVSFAISFCYPFIWNIIPSILRTQALNTKKPDRQESCDGRCAGRLFPDGAVHSPEVYFDACDSERAEFRVLVRHLV